MFNLTPKIEKLKVFRVSSAFLPCSVILYAKAISSYIFCIAVKSLCSHLSHICMTQSSVAQLFSLQRLLQ